MKDIILIILAMFLFISFLAGAAFSQKDRCNYTSILSRVNLAFVAGCELTRPRFEPYKPNQNQTDLYTLRLTANFS